MIRRWTIVLFLAGAVGVPLAAQVSFDRILNAGAEPQNWLTYSGNVMGQRHSLLTQITPANVKNLELQWIWQARSLEKFETTPLVVDGVLYAVEAPNTVVALDAVTGRVFWTFPYTPAPESRPCCGRVNRGLAILGQTLFMGTIDAHLIAIDAVTGKPLWNTEITIPDGPEGAKNRYGVTHAPLVVKDKVIVGTFGGDGPIRGFIDAYDVKTGKQMWRFTRFRRRASLAAKLGRRATAGGPEGARYGTPALTTPPRT